jgi:hypothetical protein
MFYDFPHKIYYINNCFFADPEKSGFPDRKTNEHTMFFNPGLEKIENHWFSIVFASEPCKTIGFSMFLPENN